MSNPDPRANPCSHSRSGIGQPTLPIPGIQVYFLNRPLREGADETRMYADIREAPTATQDSGSLLNDLSPAGDIGVDQGGCCGFDGARR